MPANLFAALRELLPDAPLLVGTVSAAAGQSLRITLDDGSKSTARGAYAIGARVFFRPGGAVEAEAPTATVVDVAV